jgi:Family of unknown function (DUF6459)
MSSAASSRRPLGSVPAVGSRPSALPALRRSPVPEHEPRPASRVTSWETVAPGRHIQGTLALAFAHDDDAGPRPTGGETSAPRTGRPGVLPEPRAWAAMFVQAAMEVAGGLRSAGQLVRWTTPDVHAILVRRGALTTRVHTPGRPVGKPRLRALNACTPRPGICEVGAVIAEPDRVRAVAFRMEGLHGRWRVTELEIG